MPRRYGFVAVAAAALVFTATAAADDFSDVYADYESDQQVTPCRFTKAQLQNARQQAQGFGDAAYTGFSAELDEEIARWNSGGCSGVSQPPPGGTNATADFFTVYADWLDDGALTRCAFSRKQLQNTLSEARKVPNFDAYAPGFRDAVRAQLRATRAGRCGLQPGTLRIVAIEEKGEPSKPLAEYVTIRNASTRSVALKGITLRDRSGHRVRLPRGYRLPRGRTLRLISGCAANRGAPVRRGGRFYACRRSELWNDAGDVVKIVGPASLVVAQRGYKRFGRVPRF